MNRQLSANSGTQRLQTINGTNCVLGGLVQDQARTSGLAVLKDKDD